MITINHLESDNPTYSEVDRDRYDNAVQHPMVRTHPETGKRHCFSRNQGKWHRRHGDGKSRPFLDDLLKQAVRPENTLRHKWRIGDIVSATIVTMHSADPNFDMKNGSYGASS